MKQLLLLFISALLLTTPSFAKGHGHGGGGHSSSHSSSGHSHVSSGAAHSGGMHSNAAGNHTAGTKHANKKSVITRSTSPRIIASRHSITLPRSSSGSNTTTIQRNNEVNYPPYFYGSYYPYYSSYYAPFFYDPYYGPFVSYFGFMYTPNYYPLSSSNYANSGEEQLIDEPMDGYVVFYNDTLSGAVTVNKRSISLETIDSGRNYDYNFHPKNQGLQYVTVYNEDDKQLNLVRLKDEPKKLWRVVHTGKLNIYDGRRGFIYKPEDIDVKTLTIQYNGAIESLNSYSAEATKKWLTQYVNQAYGSNLDPKNFSWNELLIYIDKLN